MKTQHLNPYDIQQMRRTMSCKEIALHYGIPVQTLYTWCYRNNVIIARVTDYEIQEGLKLYTVKELSALYNVKIGTIYARIKKMGIGIPGKFDEQTIRELRNKGYTYKEIACKQGLNYGSLLNWKNKRQ